MARLGRPPKGQTASTMLECAHCGKPYRRLLSRLHAGAKFCGHRCHSDSLRGRRVLTEEGYKLHAQRFVGNSHPNWRGGRERWAKMHKAWCERNRESVNQRNAQRRARLRKSPGKFTLEEWLGLKATHDYRCVACGRREPEIKLTRDHIIPISRGGWNTIDNIQPMCSPCNSRKKNRLAAEHGVYIPAPGEVEVVRVTP